MKLKSIFVLLDLLTIVAYPIVFVYGKLRQFPRPNKGLRLANLAVMLPVATES